MNPVDCVALAIFMFEGANQCRPTTRNIRNLNPGNLRPVHQGAGLVAIDPDGYRVFNTFGDGWAALRSDIIFKLNNHLHPTDTLLDFFNLYAPGADHNDPHGYAQFVCRWLTQAMGHTTTVDTPISEIFHNA